jgi:hypothetical protein
MGCTTRGAVNDGETGGVPAEKNSALCISAAQHGKTRFLTSYPQPEHAAERATHSFAHIQASQRAQVRQ